MGCLLLFIWYWYKPLGTGSSLWGMHLVRGDLYGVFDMGYLLCDIGKCLVCGLCYGAFDMGCY